MIGAVGQLRELGGDGDGIAVRQLQRRRMGFIFLAHDESAVDGSRISIRDDLQSTADWKNRGKSGASWVCTLVQVSATNSKLDIAFKRLHQNYLRFQTIEPAGLLHSGEFTS
jgi:hypothetical protein